ncbi:MAG: UDP-glucose 4-epimerase GalE [Methanobacteriota archaeon]|nr:MAG: UDP-glucose 4-epimerase GalE [Euryarchaeota archaeon]
MKALVVGGAGYIGSHMLVLLKEKGVDTVVFDNLSTGHRNSVLYGEFVHGDLADAQHLEWLFNQYDFDIVLHFASSISVSESVSDPLKYYKNNVVNTLNLLDAMIRHNVMNIVFSSSAAVYGEPQSVPMDEKHPKFPVSTYGRSKLMVEQVLADFALAYGLKYVVLRYFNAAGADPYGRLGELHEPETHLIPLALRVAAGKAESLNVYGDDYNSEDGTCIRDYIHVSDLCRAHWMSMNYLIDSNQSDVFNLGTGEGVSVRRVVNICRQITGREIRVRYQPRRQGDPVELVADPRKAMATLGWKPELSNIETIIAHAWSWESKR